MWNLATGQQTGAIRGKPPISISHVVSPDGKYLALKGLIDEPSRNTIEFWSFETGELVKKINCDEEPYTLMIGDFAAFNQFFTY